MTEGVATPVATPRVSVIMPSYNHAHYIERAIRSVVGQSYPNIELIVVDDGSRDGSPELLQRLSAELGFTLIIQPNAGVCRTLNRGIHEFATGEWIALLASDDFWRLDKIERQLAALRAMPESRFCFSQAREFRDEACADDGRVFPARVRAGSVLDRVFLRQHVPAGTMMFARSLYDELGGFDDGLGEEDWDFVIRSAAASPFAAVAEPLLYYRAHEGNTMRTAGRRRIFQRKAMLLAKNMHLVSPWRWLAAIVFHFAHDIGLSVLRGRAA